MIPSNNDIFCKAYQTSSDIVSRHGRENGVLGECSTFAWCRVCFRWASSTSIAKCAVLMFCFAFLCLCFLFCFAFFVLCSVLSSIRFVLCSFCVLLCCVFVCVCSYWCFWPWFLFFCVFVLCVFCQCNTKLLLFLSLQRMARHTKYRCKMRNEQLLPPNSFHFAQEVFVCHAAYAIRVHS